MADSNWDNGGGAPTRKGTSTWVKVTLGCGLALILGTASCVGGCLYIGKRAKQDPEGFKRSLLTYVKQFIREDWEDLRGMVTQLGSDAGAQELYRSAPGLKERFPTEEDFVQAARRWRPILEPIPADIPDLEAHDVSYNTQFGGQVVLSYRQKNGARVRITWDGKRRKDLARASQLMDIDVQP